MSRPTAAVLHSFAPIESPRARVLILGSMPGVASLSAGRYYAHPQNRFWPIMGELIGAGPELAYERRIEALRAAGVALWDVLAQCEREGSLDSAIRDDTAVANDFAGFLARHRQVRTVLFNGAKAEHSFRRFVLKPLARPDLRLLRLPSTSPANASQRGEAKLAAWREALGEAGVKVRGG
ncbi:MULTISPECIES: DNA-deoxyinosine glycosylase [unclassified Lysobacter]|uniref:DNA-deoxyinosine glycosylase n=1 Tax=unclassified Lysobacter TaxID=2635362 RepID=UPI001BEB3E5F|nr:MULTISPECIES: DNA-deoxyinosine glycosylase [unclassified Lysobacter]MBT2748796.1 DNA-deoxyinosine glycosylase [Lysobacter sp. ISL-42]MBT2754239.1 DNA-deoxyinosine glycosylase [Lysobacter sp. ISL-50]MBT2779753.1 DNA-deoxyinosine glycosylase [Lysobacter sp. ISL-54]MBT2783057.1 DNA-deoxyinosine glycosylase [Lysobacter sp. ISL-52]